MSLVQQLREDWIAHGRDASLPGFRAIAVHRFGVWARLPRARVSGAILRRVHRSLFRYVRSHYGIELPVTTAVGRRVVILHQSGIVVHANAVIGDDCILRHNVTIGAVTFETIADAPRIGRGVQIGCGAVILGGIDVGEGARIGPNTLVLLDVPPGASVFVSAPRMLQLTKSPVPELAPDGGRDRRGETVSAGGVK